MFEYNYEQIDQRQEKTKRLILFFSILPLAISSSFLILFFLFPTGHGLFPAPNEIPTKEIAERKIWLMSILIISLITHIFSYKIFIKNDLRLGLIPFFGVVFSILFCLTSQMFSQKYFEFYFGSSPYFHFNSSRFFEGIFFIFLFQTIFSLIILTFSSVFFFCLGKISSKFRPLK